MSGWRSRLRRTPASETAQAPLYDQVWQTDTLTRAWREVRRGGGIGVDGQTVADFEADWAARMAELAATLRARRYQPLPPRTFTLARPDGRGRPIALLTLRDRIVQRAVLDVVQPRFVEVAAPAAFGALPGRGVQAALSRVEQARAQGLTWVVRTDIQAFFEQVEHRHILTTFAATVGDEPLTELVRGWLLAGESPDPPTGEVLRDDLDLSAFGRPGALAILQDGIDLVRLIEDHWDRSGLLPLLTARAIDGVAGRLHRPRLPGRRLPYAAGFGLLTLGALMAAKRRLPREAREGARFRGRGTAQGAPLSPLLATATLDPLDRALERPGQQPIRYVDDLLVVCAGEEQAREALTTTRRVVTRMGLALNEAKTFVGPYDASFRFLGVTLPHATPANPDTAGLQSLAEDFRDTPYWQARRGWEARRQRPPVTRRRKGGRRF